MLSDCAAILCRKMFATRPLPYLCLKYAAGVKCQAAYMCGAAVLVPAAAYSHRFLALISDGAEQSVILFARLG